MNNIINYIDTLSSKRTNYFIVPGSSDIASEIKSLRIQNAILRNANVALEAQMTLFVGTPQRVLEFRNLSHNQAKKEIIKYIQAKGKVYYSKISDDLQIDIEDVVKICDELEKDGEIKGV